MKTYKGIVYFWLGTMLQIGIICCLIAVLKFNKINYNKIAELTFLVIGGLSSAIWGFIISRKTGRVKQYIQIVKDFFNMKQSFKYYCMTVLFLMIIIIKQLVYGEMRDNIKWYTFFLLFVQSLLFGGVEEIGWRYTFQPMLEKYMPFEIASMVTFFSWAIWHYMYFYLVGAFGNLSNVPFLLMLLSSSFILGAIYYISGSLWLCVIYHALLNTFSQTLMMTSLLQTIITTVICIFLSIILVRRCPRVRC